MLDISYKQRSAFKPNFFDILTNRALRNAFFIFLEETLCSENLLLFEKIEEFLSFNRAEDQAERCMILEFIFQNFLNQEAKYFVFVNSKKLRALTVQRENPSPHALNDIKRDILQILKIDCWERFLQSDSFQTFLESQPDSPEMAASRNRLEYFFGEPLRGHLKRIELTRLLCVQPCSRSTMERLKNQEKFAGFSFSKTK